MRTPAAASTVGFALACALTASAASAQEAMVRASCAEKGRIVYREDFKASSASDKRILIAAANPGAMCVFLDVAPTPEASVNASVLPNVESPPSMGLQVSDPGLAAALSIIAEGKIGDAYPKGISAVIEGTVKPSTIKPQAEGQFLNLTIGVYKGVPLDGVMNHWKLMQKDTKVLAKLTPTINKVDDVTMLSVENVPDESVVALCEEAALNGAGCIAVY